MPTHRLFPFRPNTESPGLAAYEITPSDSTDLVEPIRAVTIGTTAGTISYISAFDGKIYTTGPLPIGTYPFFATRIRLTGTSAVGLTGWV